MVQRFRTRPVWALLLATALFAAACGTSGDDSSPTTTGNVAEAVDDLVSGDPTPDDVAGVDTVCDWAENDPDNLADNWVQEVGGSWASYGSLHDKAWYTDEFGTVAVFYNCTEHWDVTVTNVERESGTAIYTPWISRSEGWGNDTSGAVVLQPDGWAAWSNQQDNELKGVEGWVTADLSWGGTITLHWDQPFVGANSVDCDITGDDDGVLHCETAYGNNNGDTGATGTQQYAAMFVLTESG